MSKKIKLLSIITSLILLFSTVTVSAQSVSIDSYLLSAGFPQEVLDTMSIPQKEFMYEQTLSKNSTFIGHESKDFIVKDDGTFEECTINSARGGTLTSADMTLSVLGTISTAPGNVVYYSVYPCFQWHKYKKVNNDSFAMNMYPGWEAIPGERNLCLHLMNNYGDSAQSVDLDPTGASSTGYTYKIPSNIGAAQGLYEGYAYYDIIKKASNATKAITLCYVHDATPLFNASYSISISGVGISVSANSSFIYTMTDNFVVSGLG